MDGQNQEVIERPFRLRRPLAITLGVVAVCALALAGGNDGCHSDGSFSLDDPSARPSFYCRATHLPGPPDTLASAIVFGVLFVGPLVIVVGGAAAALARRDGAILTVAGLMAGALAALSLILTVFANVGYRAVV